MVLSYGISLLVAIFLINIFFRNLKLFWKYINVFATLFFYVSLISFIEREKILKETNRSYDASLAFFRAHTLVMIMYPIFFYLTKPLT